MTAHQLGQKGDCRVPWCRFGIQDYVWRSPAARLPYYPTCRACGKERKR